MARFSFRRNVFDLSHTNLLTCRMGQLVPVFCELMSPGDGFYMRPSVVMRIAPLLAPLMHNVKVTFHTFKYPVRCTMKDGAWEDFITGGKNNDNSDVLPYISVPSGGFPVGSLGDYLDCCTETSGYNVPAIIFRTYAAIFNNWYRDEDLQDELPISLEMGNEGPDTVTNTVLQNRNWMRDLYTSARPAQQKGPVATLPFTGEIDVVGNGSLGLTGLTNSGSTYEGVLTGGVAPTSGGAVRVLGSGSRSSGASGFLAVGSSATPLTTKNDSSLGVSSIPGNSGLIADITNSNISLTIPELRFSNVVQEFSESLMQWGSRYVEFIGSQFGVKASDGRLQIPMYCGGSTSRLVVQPVLQTSSSDITSPQGNMAGQAFAAQSSKRFKVYADEHMIVMTLMSIMPDTMYMQGLPVWFNYASRYDFPIPRFAHLSEKPILNRNIYVQGNSQDDENFGFQPIYEECRRIPNKVHGQFRTTLDYWHMARKFSSLPKLNGDFVRSDPTMRINAVTDEDNCWCDVLMDIKAKRVLPKRGTPSL